jgi:pyruvate dehydrogenase E1 component
VATIVRHGLRRMWLENEDTIYYLTLYNENQPMPAIPDDVAAGVVEGLYRWADAPKGPKHAATILFSGSANLAAREAQAQLAEHYDVAAELHSATSYKRLREQALTTERWNRLHPDQSPRTARVTELLAGEGPIIAVTDFMKAIPDQIARWVPAGRRFTPLGTDGFGRSDTRDALRRYFEVDAPHIVVATLAALAADGALEPAVVSEAIQRYGLDPDRADPRVTP